MSVVPPTLGMLLRSRRPVNDAEGQFHDRATDNGWHVTKRGWPDFFCCKDGRICLVEVKPRPARPENRNLMVEQAIVMQALATYGVPCYRWNPISGFERIQPEPDL